jgi:hypothetical protein
MLLERKISWITSSHLGPLAQVTVIVAIGCNSLPSLWNCLPKIFLVHLEGTLSNEISPQLRAGCFEKQKSNGQFAFHIFLIIPSKYPLPTAYCRRKIKNEFPLDALCWVRPLECGILGVHEISITWLHLGQVLISRTWHHKEVTPLI